MKKISDFNNATEKYPVIYAGSATRPEFVDMPTILQQQEGVAPMDTCPAQWWNAMWKLATRDINAFRDYVGDAFTEINNLLTKFGITLDDADSEQLYDFFHDDYVQDYLKGIFVNKTGDTIDGDLHIKGDLSVDGIGEEIISTELKVGANTITLRNDNPTALGNTELAGVVTENYDGNNHNNIIAITKDGEARTGDIDIATRILYSNDGINFYTDEDLTTPATIGATEEVRDTGNQTSGGVEIYEGITYSNNDTQPLLTREEASQLPNGIALVWDAQNKRAIGGYTAGSSAISTSTTVIDNIPVSNNSSIKVMFTADISDTNATAGITPLEITYNSVSIPVKANKNGVLVDIFAKEVQTNTWKYLQAYTTLELIYLSDYDGQGNPAFIILGNPILLSGSNYTISADGRKGVDDSFPVGSIYVQYPSQSAPGSLFGLTEWQDISSDYDGAFFRANGGDSYSFGNQQAEGLPNITGRLDFPTLMNGNYGYITGKDGAFNDTTATGNFRPNVSLTNGTGDLILKFDASKYSSIYGNSQHVTPLNYSIKIWKRIA